MHRRTLRAFAALGAVILAVSCASPGDDQVAASGTAAAVPGRDDRQCFLPDQINGFTDAGNRSVVVTTGPRDYYQFETFGYCPDLDFTQAIGIRSTGGSPWICSGLDAELIVPSTIGTQRCQVGNIRKLTEAEVEARRGKPAD
jgi:hypothetical protein